jgi:peptidoglycan hydrolase CwlO-like protein
MSLTYEDLQAIRGIVEETVNPIQGDIEVLSNDIKEIYGKLADVQKETINKSTFESQPRRQDFTLTC